MRALFRDGSADLDLQSARAHRDGCREPLQVASLKTVREAMETAAALRPSVPAMLEDDDDDGQSERDGALLAALMRAPAPPAAPANGTDSK